VAITLPAAKAEEAARAIRQLPSVEAVEVGDAGNGRVRLLALPKRDKDIAQTLRGLCADNDWPIGEFHIERGKMDEVFRSITSGKAKEQAHA